MRSIDELVPPIENDTTPEVKPNDEVVAKMVESMQNVVKESLDAQRVATDRMTETFKNAFNSSNEDDEKNKDEREENEE